MSMRNVLLCALLALGPVAMPAVAAVSVSINLGVAPPAPRYELVPAPRSGYAWAPGYWQWEGQRHVWAPGRWLEARPGSYWVADRWEPRDGRHYYEPGHWKEDKKVKHEDKGNGKGRAKGHDR
jgi:WXXGXW repeat (2 copies)